MVARQGNDILVVTDLEKVLYDDAVDRAASHSQAGVSTSGNDRPFCFSGVHDCWETSRNTYGHLSYLSPIEILPVAVVSQWHHRKTTIHVHAKIVMGLPWVSFHLLHGRFTLLPFSALYLIMRSCVGVYNRWTKRSSRQFYIIYSMQSYDELCLHLKLLPSQPVEVAFLEFLEVKGHVHI